MFYNILDFGAVGDGKSINTVAIQAAIDSCAENGGGEVYVPSGVYVTGALEIKDHITLYLSNGAVIKASDKRTDFPTNGFYHNEMHETTSLIWAINRKNVVIKGDGTIDINSDAYYPDDYGKNYGVRPYKDLTYEQRRDYILDKNDERINQPIFFESCENIRIDGVTVMNSTCWTLVFSRSKHIRVSGVTINNSLVVQNDDGIHFSACTDGIVSDCNISCADDCIAMTCITDRGGKNDRIVINNCILRSRSAAVRIGHRSENILVSNILIHDTNRGIGIFTSDGGVIKNVSISNISLETKIFTAGWWGKGEAVIICAAFENSIVENVSIQSLSGSSENGIAVYGNNRNIKNVRFYDIDLAVKKCTDFETFCGCIDMRPYAFESGLSEPFLLYVNGVDAPQTERVSIYNKQ